MAKPSQDAKGRPTTRSPLYTSKQRELTKRQFIADNGKDTDGAYRIRAIKETKNDRA